MLMANEQWKFLFNLIAKIMSKDKAQISDCCGYNT